MDTAAPAKHPIDALLRRSDELQAVLLQAIEAGSFESSPRAQASLGMCSVALDHATSLRMLMMAGLTTSAVGLMRLQFEALTRAMWLLYAAKEAAIIKVLAPLTPENEQSAKSLPSVSGMIDEIGKCAGTRAPVAAYQQLAHFKEVSWHALNSYVHGGIHALRRQADGFPADLASGILRNSNALVTMTGMLLAVLTSDEAIDKRVRLLQLEFADCLPDLSKP